MPLKDSWEYMGLLEQSCYGKITFEMQLFFTFTAFFRFTHFLIITADFIAADGADSVLNLPKSKYL